MLEGGGVGWGYHECITHAPYAPRAPQTGEGDVLESGSGLFDATCCGPTSGQLYESPLWKFPNDRRLPSDRGYKQGGIHQP